MHRGVLLGVCLLVLPCQGGCLYCAYPKLDFTPPTKIEAPSDQVRAFRVDTTTQGVLPLAGFLRVPEAELYRWDFKPSSQRLKELELANATELPIQLQASFSYGFAIPIIVVNALIHTSHSVSVRLYRPGYELVEVSRWPAAQVTWKPARDFESQKKALDTLMAWPLEPGSASPAHRHALLFGAAEYDRLTRIAPTTGSLELQENAEALRKLAEK